MFYSKNLYKYSFSKYLIRDLYLFILYVNRKNDHPDYDNSEIRSSIFNFPVNFGSVLTFVFDMRFELHELHYIETKNLL
ncbi:hypothetical protein FH5T_06715 [Draconibacterium orientale]|uniref:Uncharacterized protein n=1 Tax=Draconibacterium orientale TaxID=1168034 RepID=A0ABN4D564_9BACT|nr:hypothetical protein FH5T_06715 [Draconibacterium orientale]